MLRALAPGGTWCSGITSASHAEGPGFKSQCVHLRRWTGDCLHRRALPCRRTESRRSHWPRGASHGGTKCGARGLHGRAAFISALGPCAALLVVAFKNPKHTHTHTHTHARARAHMHEDALELLPQPCRSIGPMGSFPQNAECGCAHWRAADMGCSLFCWGLRPPLRSRFSRAFQRVRHAISLLQLMGSRAARGKNQYYL